MDRLIIRVTNEMLVAAAIVLATVGLASADGIQDNSFLIEEAYNQEPGIIQHIFNWVPQWDNDHDTRSRTFDFLFTQEWPLGSQLHQFSYQIPLSSTFEDPPGGPTTRASGLGDLQLNYRYQLLNEGQHGVACAPRASIILPSGDENNGLGTGEVGYQFNLPISKQAGNFAHHFNAGLTATPNADVLLDGGDLSPQRDLIGYNLGVSTIFIKSDTFQPLVELVADWNSQFDDVGALERGFQLTLNPGFRWAVMTREESQIVVGASVPIGLTSETPDIGAFFYLSIEHPLGHRGDCDCDACCCE